MGKEEELRRKEDKEENNKTGEYERGTPMAKHVQNQGHTNLKCEMSRHMDNTESSEEWKHLQKANPTESKDMKKRKMDRTFMN